MSKKLKLSQWHDWSVKPVRKGVYERFGGGAYSFWDGFEWKCHRIDVAGAYECKDDIFGSTFQYGEWRGIVK